MNDGSGHASLATYCFHTAFGDELRLSVVPDRPVVLAVGGSGYGKSSGLWSLAEQYAATYPRVPIYVIGLADVTECPWAAIDPDVIHKVGPIPPRQMLHSPPSRDSIVICEHAQWVARSMADEFWPAWLDYCLKNHIQFFVGAESLQQLLISGHREGWPLDFCSLVFDCNESATTEAIATRSPCFDISHSTLTESMRLSIQEPGRSPTAQSQRWPSTRRHYRRDDNA